MLRLVQVSMPHTCCSLFLPRPLQPSTGVNYTQLFCPLLRKPALMPSFQELTSPFSGHFCSLAGSGVLDHCRTVTPGRVQGDACHLL